MARLSICLLVIFLAIVAEAATQKPKKAKKCRDKKNYPVCFKTKNLYCPPQCPRDCYVDCATCTPVCSKPSKSPPFLPPPPPSLSPPPTTSTPPSSSTPPPPPASTPPLSPPPATTTPLLKILHHHQVQVNQLQRELGARTGTMPLAMVRSTPVLVPAPINVRLIVPFARPFATVTGQVLCAKTRDSSVEMESPSTSMEKKDRDFCIVSDSNLHINAHFIGRRNEKLTRDFTWVQSLGILFGTHKLFIGAQKTATWDDSVDRLSLALDGEPIYLPDGEGMKWKAEISPSVTITRSSDANAVVIEAEDNFKIKAAVVPITQKDSRIHNYGIASESCFAHLDLSFKFYKLSGDVNGVLGQTYGSNYVSRVKMGVLMPVLGGEKEFASSNIFATDCAVARFSGQHPSSNSSENFEFANLHCASGIDGRGVVCKR
ncbi:hypothetical protein H0E87_017050 [Populus deltoides]|uniref:Uncharacterized protein n=1 Tax=Populus deltoides TaxID=3696 RepID=A0A8T2XYT2_POPDE|nr:hypothetical protein H0E87_017050 [Populus deltoides]